MQMEDKISDLEDRNLEIIQKWTKKKELKKKKRAKPEWPMELNQKDKYENNWDTRRREGEGGKVFI